ncbi:MAG: tyrosine-type recombinase/integrase [Alphaproteobacteria bacterium]
MEKHELEALAKRYLAQKNLAEATLKSYSFAYKHFINYLKTNEIEYAKTSDVISYREHRRSLGDSSYWLYIQICALKGLYSYLKSNQARLNLPQEYAYDILGPIKNERITPNIKKPILTIQEAKKLLLETKKNRKYLWDFRDYAIVYLMLTSGLKPGEIVLLKRDDYQIKKDKYILYIRKNDLINGDEFVHLSKGAKIALDDYLARRKDKFNYLFVQHKNPTEDGRLRRMFYWDMFKRVLLKAGLEGLEITPHCLRHTAAIMNLERGATVEQTKAFLRHSSIDSTMVYVNYLKSLKDNSNERIETFILQEEPFDCYLNLPSYIRDMKEI